MFRGSRSERLSWPVLALAMPPDFKLWSALETLFPSYSRQPMQCLFFKVPPGVPLPAAWRSTGFFPHVSGRVSLPVDSIALEGC